MDHEAGAGRARETTRTPDPSTTRIWSDPQAHRVHTVWPVAVGCRDTTCQGSAASGHPQCGQAVPVVLVVLLMCGSSSERVRPAVLSARRIVVTRQGCDDASVHVQLDLPDGTVKRGLHD